MENLYAIVAVKAAAALLLALAVAGAARWLRRPALVHLLWVIVLLELLSPPLFSVGVVPRTVLPAATLETVSSISIPSPVVLADAALVPEVRSTPVGLTRILPIALGAVWATGALAMLLLTVVRLCRFGRLLGRTTPAPEELRSAGRGLAARLGLSRCPPIRLVPAGISPMLRPRWGSLELLFPAALLDRLSRGERDALLAHELAHVRRRDHWVRMLELISTALFWWHPVVWWARSRLRRAEERCCDDLVLATLPAHANDYAKGLVKTVEFLATSRPGLPALASGIGGARILEERLTMIMKGRRTKSLSGTQRLLLALVAGALLVVFPTWADRSPDRDAELREREENVAAREAETRQSLLALEHEAQELEMALREVRVRQRELESGLVAQHQELELSRLDLEIARTEAEGRLEEVEELRHEQEWLRQHAALEAEREKLELDSERVIMAEEARVRQMMLEAEFRAQAERSEEAAQIQAEAREAEARMEAIVRETHQRQRELEQREVHLELDRLRREIELARAEGRGAEAAELERHLAGIQRELEAVARERARHDNERALHLELRQLELELQRLLEEGRNSGAATIEKQIQELIESLERRDTIR